MGFLRQFLRYQQVCIQCHNNPDADTIAAAFGLYRYLTAHGVSASMFYGGEQVVKKNCTRLMIRECGIPLEHRRQLPEEPELLLLADCQYRQGNVECFPAGTVAIVDHHIRVVEENERYLIKSNYQSCSAVVWELLREEGYPVEQDEALSVALLYGLYTDTSGFSDLYHGADMAMRTALFAEQPLFDRLTKSNLSLAELLVASEAMYHHYFDVERRMAIVEALKCDQTVLGTIGDFMIQVDAIDLSFAYTRADTGYQISLRSCREDLPANEAAAFLCREIGSGGGHRKKAGGRIQREKVQALYGEKQFFDVVNDLLCQYIDQKCGT